MKNETFQLTEDHIKLLSLMWVDWQDCETGAPEIDPKRPYGNSDVVGDIADALGWDNRIDPDTGDRVVDHEKRAMKLHRETRTALQIVLRTKSFVPGLYEADLYSENWRLSQ